MSNIVIRPKDRAEWLEYRKDGIGSSEVATILGLNPWETPYQLWRRKKGLDAPKDSTKFDAKAFQKEHSDLCAPYMVTAPGSRRFIIK